MTDTHSTASLHRVGWLFPGQGSQHVGMAQALAAEFPVARETMAEADDVLGIALSSLCFDGPEETLVDTINAQPALMAASMAALRVLEEELGLGGDALGAGLAAGHSMGEYTALVAAGSLRYADGLRLVRTRGRLMKEAGEREPGMMAAVLGLDAAQVIQICAEVSEKGGVVQLANDNCPGQIVVSGDKAGMEAAMAALAAAGAKKVVPLAVSIAAHSPLMRPAAEELSAAIEDTEIRLPVIPVYGNRTAQPLVTLDAIRAELRGQLTGSVRWTETVQNMATAGAATFVEVGPGEVLAGLVKRIDRSLIRLGVRDPETLRAAVAQLTAPNSLGAVA